MTNDGNFNINKLNTVDIPILNAAISNPSISSAGSTIFGRIQFYYDADHFYTTNEGLGGFYQAPVDDITNGDYITKAQIGGFGDPPVSIYPTPISGYFYNFSSRNPFGDGGGTISRATTDDPLAWYATGISTASDACRPMIYYDGSNIYLIGGRVSSTAVDSIDIASAATPTSFSVSAHTLPATRVNGTLVTVGSTIYMYGGYNNASATVDTIFSASTSAPDVWSDTGDTLPVAIHGACGYNDGTNVYLFGGTVAGVGVNTIRRASVSTPTSFSSVGTLPTTAINLGFYINGAYAYLFSDSGVWRASTSDLLTWTVITNGLAVAVRSSHIAKVDDTIYMFGGFTDAGATQVTKTAHIQSASVTNPLSWTDLGALLPASLGGGQLFRTKNWLYIIGGSSSGNYYRASVDTPTTWLLAGTDGPSSHGGRAMIVDGEIYYLGGEFVIGTNSSYIASAGIDVNSSPSGDLTPWKSNVNTYHPMALPILLSRFTLIVAGNFVYVLGGTTSGGVMNFNVYRNNLSIINNSWLTIGTINNPMVDAHLAIINGFAYISGGGPSSAFTTTDDYILSASMSELANGNAIFAEENGAHSPFGADGSVMVVNDDVYYFGGRLSTVPVTSINKTFLKTKHILVSPVVPETTHSLPTVELQSGAIGSYTSFQRTGMLPWLLTDK